MEGSQMHGFAEGIILMVIIIIVSLIAGLFFIRFVSNKLIELKSNDGSIPSSTKNLLKLFLYPSLIFLGCTLILMGFIISGDLSVYDYRGHVDLEGALGYLLGRVSLSCFVLFIKSIMTLLNKENLLSKTFLFFCVFGSAIVSVVAFLGFASLTHF